MPCIRVCPRRGIKLVEVGIVLGMVVLLVGVGVVALPTWWENSARTRCLEHLEKIGKAMTLHQDQQKRLPASFLSKGYAIWAVQLIPYLPGAQESPLLKWDLPAAYYAQPDGLRQTQIITFYCPARRSPPQNSVAGDSPENEKAADKLFPGALGDYACSSGDGNSDWTGTKANGAIIPAEVVKKTGEQLVKWELLIDLDNLPRGKSATLLVGEKHVPFGEFGQVAAGDGSLYNGDYPASFARLGGPGFGLAQSRHDKLNKNFGSAHRGVCQLLMADGSAKAYSNSLNEEVLGKLTNRNK